jgi:hypothetical protein
VARLTGVPSTNRGAIMFETDLPSQSKVQVPVVVSVRR